MHVLYTCSVSHNIDRKYIYLSLQATLQSPVMRSVLEDIFLVRRIQTIAEVFAMCTQMACTFKGTGPLSVYDDAALCKPVRR